MQGLWSGNSVLYKNLPFLIVIYDLFQGNKYFISFSYLALLCV